ncbi:hypothetical protein EVAR_90319_1 [Eumeta japonica]|uniref:Uncharacterized protein n=1 Tax=Eumeta variegata TaxID=151549 RepID=A0A4C1ZJY6_EUMVA|nr:hypothetical protein EVAR_90319_1 [Eumeta japonica]
MNALTRQDVLSEQEFHPLSCSAHKRYTATVVVWRPTPVIRGRYRALYGNRNRSPIHPPPPPGAIDKLGQWFRKWRIEVTPTNQQPYNSGMVRLESTHCQQNTPNLKMLDANISVATELQILESRSIKSTLPRSYRRVRNLHFLQSKARGHAR